MYIESVEYLVIAITPRFTLIWNDNTCLGPIYELNRSV